MSRFSGTYDLYDFVFSHQDGEGEMKSFNEFKEKTGGKIYQYFEMELTESNIDTEIKLCNDPLMLSKREVPSEQGTSRKRRKPKFIYTYFGKEYDSLKKINKHHYITKKEIRFETLLDIIPYYPHAVSMSYTTKDSTYVVISDKSYVDISYENSRKYGYVNELHYYYTKELQNHYISVVKRYFLGHG